MSKKKNLVKPITIDPMTIWHIQKPQYNGYICGYGAHGKNKYSRKQKHKVDWRDYDRS